MFAFVVYAVLVWYAAAKWRRRWPSFAWVALGVIGLVGLAYLHYWMNIWTHGKIYLPVLRSILYPYIVLVGVVGAYIACLPRTIPGQVRCSVCRYDLAGLRLPAVCPECGTRHSVSPSKPSTTGPEEEPASASGRWSAPAAPSAWFRSSDQ